jgi:hypothetical protein
MKMKLTATRSNNIVVALTKYDTIFIINHKDSRRRINMDLCSAAAIGVIVILLTFAVGFFVGWRERGKM